MILYLTTHRISSVVLTQSMPSSAFTVYSSIISVVQYFRLSATTIVTQRPSMLLRTCLDLSDNSKAGTTIMLRAFGRMTAGLMQRRLLLLALNMVLIPSKITTVCVSLPSTATSGTSKSVLGRQASSHDLISFQEQLLELYQHYDGRYIRYLCFHDL